ncbi:MAG TPA: DMT family transporter [Burkholderiales bacterium]|nr:DMT family transporter [Burkholderiales bacterium]
MTRSNLVAGLAWIGLAILCWTPLFSVAKRTLPYLDAYALGSVRYLFGIALFVLLLIAFEGRQALRYDGRLGAATLYGLIGITGFNLFVWLGLGTTRPEHASIILALQTPLTAIAVWLVRGHRPAAFTLGCVVIAFAGVVLVVTKGNPHAAIAGGELLGDVLVFCGALAWVTYTLAGAWKFAGWSPLRMTVLTCIPGTVGLLAANAIAIVLGQSEIPTFQSISAVAWQILYFSVGTVVLGVLGFNAAARRLGPLNTMLMLNLIPLGVFGIEAALGRSFAAIELIGALVVIGALVANNLYLRGVSTSR